MENISREHQIALITGGASGIGLAISQRLHDMGMKVVIASRRESLINELALKLNQIRPNSACAITMDVRNKNAVTTAINQLPAGFNQIDVIINNAGLGVTDSLLSCSEENWDLVLDTTLKGTFLVTQALLPRLIQKQAGYVINIASQASKYGYANAGPYCAAKFALIGFAKALQEEVREHNIQVHNLMPALTQVPAPMHESDMTLGWLQTSDLADCVEFLLTRPARVNLEDIGLMGR